MLDPYDFGTAVLPQLHYGQVGTSGTVQPRGNEPDDVDDDAPTEQWVKDALGFDPKEIEAGGPGSGRHPYAVYIHKAYFPTQPHSKIGKEDYEQWTVKAPSRQAAAEMVWRQHGDRLLRQMNPQQTQLPRKVSLYVSDPKTGTAPGRLQPILVHPSKVRLQK